MDLKYKHFYEERILPAPRDVVVEAVRQFMTESLGWKLTNTSDGFQAEGYSFSHHARADFHIESTEGQTKLVVELLVKRAGPFGFMLFDVGGYYDIQLRKWSDAIRWNIQQELTPGQVTTSDPLVIAANKPSAHVFNGCLVFIAVMFGLYVLVTIVCAVIGLFSGQLYLLGRSGTLVVHGMAARIVSAVILSIGAFLIWRIGTTSPKRRIL